MEHKVPQRSEEWYQLRRELVVTASKFGDAVGVGRGKPYHFYRSLLEVDTGSEESPYTRHGVEMEPIIHEAYDLLTGSKTRESGLWTITDENDLLKGLIGASPDAIVLDKGTSNMIGLCEFKAPVHQMYAGIPRQYMVQMQGQMAVTGLPWCDFMAVCVKTREIMLRRVYFHRQFWTFIASRLLVFCRAVKTARLSKSPLDYPGDLNVSTVKTWTICDKPFPHEQNIKVDDLLQPNIAGSNCYRGPSCVTMTFDFLMGQGQEMSPELKDKLSGILEDLDFRIEEKEIEQAMISSDL